MQRYRQHLNADVVLAVGAAFDFIAGTVSQAPPIMQRLGLEWLYRLAMEPKRLWKRYFFRNPYFIVAFAMQYLRYLTTIPHKK
jgi:N-acetylglucosaminyldiphosphoundecaprenol N-acetyl-beta-D-mannosaminyltransferase